MNTRTDVPDCQLRCVPHFAQPIGAPDKVGNVFSRAKRFSKRRLTYIKNYLSRDALQRGNINSAGKNADSIQLQTGDLVRVKSKEAIQSTLNDWNRLKGCAFLEEMWPYCGTTQHVLKRMERFLDERDYQVKKTNGVVLLDGVICTGTVDFGKCDRSCFFFWRQEWLEKIDRGI